jgi:hypothetical protein
MTTFDYRKLQASAYEMLKKFGTDGQIRRSTAAFDPVTGKKTTNTYDETSAKMVSLPSNNFLVSFDETIDEQIKRIGRVFIVASKGIGFEPVVGDLIRFDGMVMEAIGTKPLNPAGVALINYVGCIESGEKWT